MTIAGLGIVVFGVYVAVFDPYDMEPIYYVAGIIAAISAWVVAIFIFEART